MKRIQRLAAAGLLAAPLLACPPTMASQGEASRASTPPPAEAGASKPRAPAPRDNGDTPAPADRLDPHAIGRAASYPGARRRVFPAE